MRAQCNLPGVTQPGLHAMLCWILSICLHIFLPAIQTPEKSHIKNQISFPQTMKSHLMIRANMMENWEKPIVVWVGQEMWCYGPYIHMITHCIFLFPSFLLGSVFNLLCIVHQMEHSLIRKMWQCNCMCELSILFEAQIDLFHSPLNKSFGHSYSAHYIYSHMA